MSWFVLGSISCKTQQCFEVFMFVVTEVHNVIVGAALVSAMENAH